MFDFYKKLNTLYGIWHLNKINRYKSKYQFYKARNYILEKLKDAHNLKDIIYLKQQLSLCYYKDNEVNYKIAFKKALLILDEVEQLLQNNKLENFNSLMAETLSLKAAIYKRYWQKEKKLSHLKNSINLYEKVYNDFKTIDNGYAGINCANLYEILSFELNKLDIKNDFLDKANTIRKDLLGIIQLNSYWDYFSLANIYLGLEDIKNCEKILKEAIDKFDIAEREKWITFKDLKLLAMIKNIKDLSFLIPLFSNTDISLKRTDLSLSGGGFRASFFHLGVLSALAEINKLKDIEVISTVSGGSIIGVLYYLKLKNLLETKEDSQITKQDYINLIKELIDEFFEGVQNNIRNKIFLTLNPLFWLPFGSYTRTIRVAELYERYFYAKYNVKYLKDLKIIPPKSQDFSPRFENFKRVHKIPILVINATNLNNGHNFQFHSTKMGESELIGEFDKNFIVEWIRFDECKEFEKFELSKAVAASTAVPGIFPALKLKLSEEIELNLVDGGVYDNQGINALLSEDCDELIVSDGGREMDNIKKIGYFYNFPKAIGSFNYIKRTTDILMDVNRDLFYEKIENISIPFVINSKNKTDKINCNNTTLNAPSIYEKISKIRTDLDRFNKDEAGILMAFGYSLAKENLKIKNESDFWFKEYLKELK